MTTDAGSRFGAAPTTAATINTHPIKRTYTQRPGNKQFHAGVAICFTARLFPGETFSRPDMAEDSSRPLHVTGTQPNYLHIVDKTPAAKHASETLRSR